MIITPATELRGTASVPGDKSISHRYAILGGLAHGVTRIRGYSDSRDCRSTLDCLQALGVAVEQTGGQVVVRGAGIAGLRQPSGMLDAGNSGTTMRLLSGVLAGLPFPTRIRGDASLNRRPMRRIIEPLTRMGAEIIAAPGEVPPLEIRGGDLRGIDYPLPVASAQVKSCVLLAGLNAAGETTVRERAPSRDHTERALPQFGAEVRRVGRAISLTGGRRLQGREVRVPGDFSAAAFLLVAGLLLPGSHVVLPDVGVNPTRFGLARLLDPEGRAIRVKRVEDWNGEPVARLEVSYQAELLRRLPSEVGGVRIPNVIDEIPILAVLGCRLPGGFRVRDAAELRKKESDRISAVVDNLRSIGVEVEEFEDGFQIPPGQTIMGGKVKTHGDHRIAMAFAVAGLTSRQGVELDQPECCEVSFPRFFEVLERLRR